MLHVDEQRALVGCGGKPADLLAVRPDEEAADVARRRIRCEQRIVAQPLHLRLQVARTQVCLDPEHAAIVDPETIRTAVNRVGAQDEPVVVLAVCRRAREDEDVPVEAGGRGVAVGLAPADDVAELVRGARIGGIDRRRHRRGGTRVAAAAAAVVG